MCGLFGAVSSTALSKDMCNFIKQSAFVGTLRGTDSTGIATVDKDNNVSVFKKALAGPDFLTSDVGVRASKMLDSSFVVIGHNRAATKGGRPTDLTAHPFAFGSIVGAHNGTLYGKQGLIEKKHEVDSMNILNSISRVTETKEVIDILENLNGSFALSWYDESSEIMWLARNEQRPLSIVDTGKAFYWTSEYNQLVWLLNRNNCLGQGKLKKVSVLPPGILFGYNTREMKVEDSIKFTPKENSYGAYRGSGGIFKKSLANAFSDYTDKIAYSYNKEFEDNVAYINIEKAIKKKFWSASDKEVMARFTAITPLGENRTTIKLVGFAYTDDGEKFPCTAYANKGSTYNSSTFYAGSAHGIFKSEHKGIIHMLFLNEKGLSPVSESVDEFKKMLDSLENKVPAALKKNRHHLIGPHRYELLTEEEFAVKVSEGCAACGVSIDPLDHKNIGWLDGENPICPDCISYM